MKKRCVSSIGFVEEHGTLSTHPCFNLFGYRQKELTLPVPTADLAHCVVQTWLCCSVVLSTREPTPGGPQGVEKAFGFSLGSHLTANLITADTTWEQKTLARHKFVRKTWRLRWNKMEESLRLHQVVVRFCLDIVCLCCFSFFFGFLLAHLRFFEIFRDFLRFLFGPSNFAIQNLVSQNHV